MTYEGIGQDSLLLLAENRFQDSKVFYEEHKEEIKRGVVIPLRRLAADLAPGILAIDPLINVDPMKNGCVSRVRRDNRFTKDKLMYRENMWVAFLRDKRAWNWCLPAYYLDFSIRRAEWGLGFYSATPAVMQQIRRIVTEQPERALDAVATAREAGFLLGGIPYARQRSTADIPQPLRPFFDCKSVELSRSESPDIMAGTDLPQRLTAGFTALAPLYHLLIEAVEYACGMREV